MRKSALLSVCVAGLAITMVAAPTLGNTTIWLSNVSTIGGGAVLGNPNLTRTINVPFLMGVWVSSPVNLKVNGMAVDYTEDGNLLTVNNVAIMETGQGGTDVRWQVDSNGTPIGINDGNLNSGPNELWTDSVLIGASSWGLTGSGILRSFDGNFDPVVDGNGGAFLVAVIQITPHTLGDTNLYLSVGKKKIGYDPDSDTNVWFGIGDPAVNREIEGAVSSAPDATIHVVPEPATMGLLVVGALGLIARRRRR